mgnify:CR=1 FL=1
MAQLEGKIAVVTGGAQGFGRAITERFVASGAKVAIWDHDLPFAEKTAKEIGPNVSTFKVDVSDLTAVEKARDETLKAFGKIDILVCNAALNPYFGPAADCPDEAFERTMGANVRSNFWLTNKVAPQSSSSPPSPACAAPTNSASTRSPKPPTCNSPATSASNGARKTSAPTASPPA